MKTNRIDDDGKSAQGRAQTKGAAAKGRGKAPKPQPPRVDADRLAGRAVREIAERHAIRETGRFTPRLVGIGHRTWAVNCLAEVVCIELGGHADWLRAQFAAMPGAKGDPWRSVRVAEACEALALCNAVEEGASADMWKDGLELRPLERDNSGARPDCRDVLGVGYFATLSAHEVLSTLAGALHWCWHDLACEALNSLPPREAVSVIDALCVLESWGSEADGLASDFDRDDRQPTRLQLAAAAARRAHHYRAAA